MKILNKYSKTESRYIIEIDNINYIREEILLNNKTRIIKWNTYPLNDSRNHDLHNFISRYGWSNKEYNRFIIDDPIPDLEVKYQTNYNNLNFNNNE